LQALGPEHPLSRWQDKIASVPPTMPLLPPNIDPEILSRIQNAVLQEKQVEVDYQRLTAEKAEPIILHPLGLILRGNIMYLIATAYDYDDVRLYALHRMKQVMLREEAINLPTDFVLSDYLEAGNGHFRSEMTDIRMEAQVSKELGYLLMETPLSLDQAIEPHAEEYRLFATVPHTWQLEWWILSQAERMMVIAPKQLSDRIKRILTDSLSQIKNRI
ncbi:MAG: WYL domain-containing protein, partial [Deltaproteobacteria bacterium]|nr:WYL domain-containing protein [Deltaproteobacteria bacterium]